MTAVAEAPALPAPLTEFLAEQIPKVATGAHKRYKAIPAEDYEQSMWLKVLSQSAKYGKLLADGQHRLITVKLRDACSKLRLEDRRYRLAVRAANDGYSVYDFEFYSTRMLGRLLPPLVEAGFDVPAAMERAAASADAAGIHIRTSDPFGGAEQYMAILVDVAAAYGRLPEGMQRLIKSYYGVGQEDTEDDRWAREGLASSMGLTADALRQRVHRALQRLQDELGGADPWL